MNDIKVLKLGWEFPPLINGGLGIACLGLSRALCKQVDLDVIVPKADHATQFDGFSLHGLNNTRLEELQAVEGRFRFDSFTEVESIPLHLDPYFSEENPDVTQAIQRGGGWARFNATTRNQLEMFKFGELYGENVGEKVIEFAKVAAKLAMQRDFDIVHAHDWMTYLAGVEVKKATGKPLVVHLHASQYDRAGADARGWIFDLEKFGMEQADAVIPVSNYTGKIVSDHYGIDPAKVHPVHNGADSVEHFRSEKKFPEPLVLFLGRLTAQKGPEFFLEIAERVLAELPDVRFVMAGTGDKFKGLIEAKAFRGLGGRFHFTGFLNKDKVNELLSMTDIYCMPSVSEPFGLSALEAAQFSIPAVISKQSGVAEVLQGALKADYWDIELMAKQIVRILKEPELREELIKQADKDVEAATWDAAAVKVVDVYRKVLNR